MKTLSPNQMLTLDELLRDLRDARGRADFGRMALLLYCEVRRWARMCGEEGLAEHSSLLVMDRRNADRGGFLRDVDLLICELEQIGLTAAGPAADAAVALGTLH